MTEQRLGLSAQVQNPTQEQLLRAKTYRNSLGEPGFTETGRVRYNRDQSINELTDTPEEESALLRFYSQRDSLPIDKRGNRGKWDNLEVDAEGNLVLEGRVHRYGLGRLLGKTKKHTRTIPGLEAVGQYVDAADRDHEFRQSYDPHVANKITVYREQEGARIDEKNARDEAQRNAQRIGFHAQHEADMRKKAAEEQAGLNMTTEDMDAPIPASVDLIQQVAAETNAKLLAGMDSGQNDAVFEEQLLEHRQALVSAQNQGELEQLDREFKLNTPRAQVLQTQILASTKLRDHIARLTHDLEVNSVYHRFFKGTDMTKLGEYPPWKVEKDRYNRLSNRHETIKNRVLKIIEREPAHIPVDPNGYRHRLQTNLVKIQKELAEMEEWLRDNHPTALGIDKMVYELVDDETQARMDAIEEPPYAP